MADQTKLMEGQKDISNRQTEIMQRQEGLSREQTKIMAGQRELSRKLYELTKIPEMQQDYDSLPADFFPFTRGGYGKYRRIVTDETLPEQLDLLIELEGFPSGFDPSKVNNTLRFIMERENAWKQFRLWNFAKAVYPHQSDQNEYVRAVGKMSERTDITKGHRSFIRFWEKWLLVFTDICEYLTPDPLQLVMLTWFQLAHIRATYEYGRPGEKEFFEFAKAEWESFKQSSG